MRRWRMKSCKVFDTRYEEGLQGVSGRILVYIPVPFHMCRILMFICAQSYNRM